MKKKIYLMVDDFTLDKVLNKNKKIGYETIDDTRILFVTIKN